MKKIYLILFTLALILGCSHNQESSKNISHVAASIGVAECESCGMVVRDQPAPRGQVVHRDGERVFFCSIGDMVLYMETPSPHGKIQQTFVEVMSEGIDPTTLSNRELDWLPGEEAGYVLGFPRKGIMGEPVLVYQNQQIAENVTQTHGGSVADFSQLRQKLIQGEGF